MKDLRNFTIFLLALGALIAIIAAATWPRGSSIFTVDYGPNIAWLSIGGGIFSLGLLSLLLLLHARAVTGVGEAEPALEAVPESTLPAVPPTPQQIAAAGERLERQQRRDATARAAANVPSYEEPAPPSRRERTTRSPF